MSRKRVFEFRVSDQEGLWGDVRCTGRTQVEAKRYCLRMLKVEHKQGSLRKGFKLTPLGTARKAVRFFTRRK